MLAKIAFILEVASRSQYFVYTSENLYEFIIIRKSVQTFMDCAHIENNKMFTGWVKLC